MTIADAFAEHFNEVVLMHGEAQVEIALNGGMPEVVLIEEGSFTVSPLLRLAGLLSRSLSYDSQGVGSVRATVAGFEVDFVAYRLEAMAYFRFGDGSELRTTFDRSEAQSGTSDETMEAKFNDFPNLEIAPQVDVPFVGDVGSHGSFGDGDEPEHMGARAARMDAELAAVREGLIGQRMTMKAGIGARTIAGRLEDVPSELMLAFVPDDESEIRVDVQVQDLTKSEAEWDRFIAKFGYRRYRLGEPQWLRVPIAVWTDVSEGAHHVRVGNLIKSIENQVRTLRRELVFTSEASEADFAIRTQATTDPILACPTVRLDSNPYQPVLVMGPDYLEERLESDQAAANRIVAALKGIPESDPDLLAGNTIEESTTAQQGKVVESAGEISDEEIEHGARGRSEIARDELGPERTVSSEAGAWEYLEPITFTAANADESISSKPATPDVVAEALEQVASESEADPIGGSVSDLLKSLMPREELEPEGLRAIVRAMEPVVLHLLHLLESDDPKLEWDGGDREYLRETIRSWQTQIGSPGKREADPATLRGLTRTLILYALDDPALASPLPAAGPDFISPPRFRLDEIDADLELDNETEQALSLLARMSQMLEDAFGLPLGVGPGVMAYIGDWAYRTADSGKRIAQAIGTFTTIGGVGYATTKVATTTEAIIEAGKAGGAAGAIFGAVVGFLLVFFAPSKPQD